MMRIMSSVGPVRRGGRSMAQVWMVRHPSSSCGSRRSWRRGSRAPRGSSLRHRGACVSRRPRISIETTWELWRLGEDRRDAEDGLGSHWVLSECLQPSGLVGRRPTRSARPLVLYCDSEPSIDGGFAARTSIRRRCGYPVPADALSTSTPKRLGWPYEQEACCLCRLDRPASASCRPPYRLSPRPLGPGPRRQARPASWRRRPLRRHAQPRRPGGSRRRRARPGPGAHRRRDHQGPPRLLHGHRPRPRRRPASGRRRRGPRHRPPGRGRRHRPG